MEEHLRTSVENLVNKVNDAYGKHIVTVEDTRICFMVHVGKNPVRRICSIYRIKYYLAGLKNGIELMKEGL